jgi:hypothetical protein
MPSESARDVQEGDITAEQIRHILTEFDERTSL